MIEAIVLDGESRSALAVTRSLGQKEIKVAVGSTTEPSLSSCSRFCQQTFRYPSPHDDPQGFLDVLRSYTASNPQAVLFPMTDITLGEVLRNKESFGSGIKIPFPEYQEYISVSDKATLFSLANRLKIPKPETIFSKDYDDSERLIQDSEKLGFPLVVKPSRSRIRTEKGWLVANVRYARDSDDLRTILNCDLFKNFPFLIQKKIEGPGIGVFVLMKEGKMLSLFSHKRIREKPPSGGVSVLCESIEPPREALKASTKLFEGLKWSGVAMVEFKIDHRDQLPKLMEINARFWGSIQLAVLSGVDFPYLLFRLAHGEVLPFQENYQIGLKLRWVLGDLDHFLIRLRRKPKELFLPQYAPTKLGVFKEFMIDFFKPSVKNEILRWDDPSPFLYELKQYFRDIIR